MDLTARMELSQNNVQPPNSNIVSALTQSTMRTTFHSFLMVGILTSVWLYQVPVPDGIAEPVKFRLLSAGSELLERLIMLQDIFWPDEPNDIITTRFLINMTYGNQSPEVTGSKFRARDTTFDGVNVRVYEPIHPVAGKLIPGFIFFHGGGWCLGNIRVYDGLTRKFADELGVVVVSVGYRLSPEHLGPNQFRDSFKATKWFVTHAQDFGVDPSRVAIGGDSGGGSLSALVMNKWLEEPELPRMKAQLLIYPLIQNIDIKTPSHQKYYHHFGYRGLMPLTKQARFLSYIFFGRKDKEFERNFVENSHTSSLYKHSPAFDRVNHSLVPKELKESSFYKGPTDKRFGDDYTWRRIEKYFHDPGVSPFLRNNLTGIPPSLIQTCGFDSLRDDGIFYWRALKTAGVEATWRNYESGFHGIFWLGGGLLEFDVGEEMRNHAFDFLRTHLDV